MSDTTPPTKLEEIFPSLPAEPDHFRPQDFREKRADNLTWAFILFFFGFSYCWAFYPILIILLIFLVILYVICRSNEVNDYKKGGFGQAWQEWYNEKQRLTEICQNMQFVLFFLDDNPDYKDGAFCRTTSISVHPMGSPQLIFRHELLFQPDWSKEQTEESEPDIIVNFPLAYYAQKNGQYSLDLGRAIDFVQPETTGLGPEQVVEP